MGTAQDSCVRHAGPVNVADIFADTAQQPDIFFAFNSLADVGHGI